MKLIRSEKNCDQVLSWQVYKCKKYKVLIGEFYVIIIQWILSVMKLSGMYEKHKCKEIEMPNTANEHYLNYT